MKDNKSKLIKSFHDSCNALVDEINKLLFDGCSDPYWIGDEVGGLCDFGDTNFLTPEEMVYILENNIEYDEYAKWRDYNIEYYEHVVEERESLYKGRTYIKLEAWHDGLRPEMITNQNQ